MAVVWTFAWYALPLVILLLRALSAFRLAGPGLHRLRVEHLHLARAEALGSLISNAPVWCFALARASPSPSFCAGRAKPGEPSPSASALRSFPAAR
jgi:hypothetical protein